MVLPINKILSKEKKRTQFSLTKLLAKMNINIVSFIQLLCSCNCVFDFKVRIVEKGLKKKDKNDRSLCSVIYLLTYII